MWEILPRLFGALSPAATALRLACKELVAEGGPSYMLRPQTSLAIAGKVLQFFERMTMCNHTLKS